MEYRNPWKKLSSRIAYANEWVRVREDQVIRPDGQPGIYGVVEVGPSVGVLAINELGQTALVGQWRYTIGRYSWEIARGGCEKGETDMVAAAQRELREETGFQAAAWSSLGAVDVCNGVTTDVQHLFIAKELTFVGTHQDPVEEIVTKWVKFEEAVERAIGGDITEVCSVAAILRYAVQR